MWCGVRVRVRVSIRARVQERNLCAGQPAACIGQGNG